MLNIHTERAGRSVIGADTTILSMPPHFIVDIGQGPTLVADALGKFLRNLAEKQATDLGEELHHANFVVTKDPATVEALGSMHDCEQCRAGVQEALRRLRDEPETDMIVGQLFWAGE